MQNTPKILHQSSRLLIEFGNLIGHRFDRQRAERILYESHLNETNKGVENWLDTVQSCAEAMEFRIRRLESNFDEVRELVSAGVPVAFLSRAILTKHKLTQSDDLHWYLITAVRGSRLRVLSLNNLESIWLPQKQICAAQGLGHRLDVAQWLVCYPVLMHEPFASYQAGRGLNEPTSHSTHSPFRRLMGILRVEWPDIFVIIVFSAVVGLLTLTTPIAVEALVNTLAFGQFTQPVLVLSFIVLILLAFSSTLTAISTYTSEIIQRRLFVRLIEDLAYRFPRVEKSNLDRSPLPELANRFLDIVTIQKSVSKLLLDGIVIILQTIIGMGVLAFYHPFLLGFDILLLLLIAFTTFVLGRGAVKSAITESAMKYQVLDWLEQIAGNASAFRVNQGWEFAVNRSDHLAIGYLDARKKHFKIVFRQVVFALGIYCLATTVLLGLGGWLVISGELSLGQLVAAELIVILIVRSFAKLGKHMESLYELLASVDKIGILLDLPMINRNKFLQLDQSQPIRLQCDQVSLRIHETAAIPNLNFRLESGDSLAVLVDSHLDLRMFADLCLAERVPDTGKVLINDIDSREYRVESIHAAFGYAGEREVFRGTLEENVHLNRSGISSQNVRDALETVGLLAAVSNLPEGFSTLLQAGGFPLSPQQADQLMLARAIVSRPQVLVVAGTFDRLRNVDLETLIKSLTKNQISVLIFTHFSEIAKLTANFVKLGN